MRKLFRLSTMIVMAFGLLTVVSCNKNESTLPDLTQDVIGKYTGTLTTGELKTTSPAEADISSVNDYTVEIHCYNENFDTTFMLELFPNGEMMNVCFTDGDFYNHYGHNQSENHHMMGGGSSWTSWAQHMNNEHDDDDMHYGNFNMQERSFEYTFILENQSEESSLTFEGNRVE